MYINSLLTGSLKCNTFSNVTVEGQEVNRFTVPSMKSGLFVSCSDDGHVIVVDVDKKSVFIIQNGEVVVLISQHPKHLVVSLKYFLAAQCYNSVH